ncbi:MAG: response regulator, partial [Syntrophobacteraceae bacterium]
MSVEKQTILIVDDEELNRKLLRAQLSVLGFAVWEAASGSEALERAKEKPDLILLDVMMPKMDGFEVCRRLKESEATCGIPVIYLSAIKESKDKVHGLALGGVDYISKPY